MSNLDMIDGFTSSYKTEKTETKRLPPAKKPDADKLKLQNVIIGLSSSVVSNSSTSTSNTTTEELKQRVKPVYVQLGELILNKRQFWYKKASKRPRLRRLFIKAGDKFNKQAKEAKENPEFIEKVNNEITKIQLANNKTKKQLIKCIGKRIEILLIDYNEALLINPNNQLIKKIQAFIIEYLAWLDSHSIESLVTGKKQSEKLIMQLRTMRDTLTTMPTTKKTSLVQQLEKITDEIVSSSFIDDIDKLSAT